MPLFEDQGRSVLEAPTYEDIIGLEPSEARITQALFEQARSTQQTWADGAATNLEYFNGAHWTPEQKEVLLGRGASPVAVQTTYQLIEQQVNSLTANAPAFRASSVEDSDNRTANVFTNLFAHIWKLSHGQYRIKQVIRDSSVQGRGIAYPYVDWNMDFGRGEVLFKDLEPKSVFPDPMCTDPLYDDASFVITRTPMTIQQLQLVAPGIVNRIHELREGLIYHGGDLGYSGTKSAHNDEIIHPFDIDSQYYRESYEVLERFEKIFQPYFRLFNPTLGREEVLSEKQYEARRAEAAFIVERGGVTQIHTKEREVKSLDELFEQVGPIHHLMPGRPAPDESGQIVQQTVLMPGPEHAGAIPGTETRLTPTVIGRLVDDGMLPLTPFRMERIRVIQSIGNTLLAKPFILPTSHYPTVAFPASHNRNPYPVSDVSRVRDLQDIINKSLSLILAHAANSTNVKVFYPDGSIQDMDYVQQMWGKAGTAMIPYEPAFGLGGSTPGGIVIVAPPQLPTALYANIDRAVMFMERTLGVYSTNEGDPARTPDTFRGLLALDEMGQRRILGRATSVYNSLTRLGEVIRDLSQWVYQEPKIIRLLQPNGEQVESAINIINYDDVTGEAEKINDITIGHFDIQIIGGSTLPLLKSAKQEVDMQMFDRGIIDDVAVLKHSDYPDADEILQRKSLLMQLGRAVEGYEQEISDLEGDIQTWQREALHAKQRTELEKFKTKLQAMGADAKASATVFRAALKNEEEKAALIAKQQTSQSESAA
jgi:hypothetical protein